MVICGGGIGGLSLALSLHAAGFSDIEILETGEFGFFRFYRLLP